MQLARTQVTLRPDAELLEKHRPQRALADAGYFAQVCQPQRTRLTLPSTSMRAMICVRDALGRPMRGPRTARVPDTVSALTDHVGRRRTDAIQRGERAAQTQCSPRPAVAT